MGSSEDVGRGSFLGCQLELCRLLMMGICNPHFFQVIRGRKEENVGWGEEEEEMIIIQKVII